MDLEEAGARLESPGRERVPLRGNCSIGEVGNVGLKTLSQFTLTFDQQHGRVRLKR
jgi:hypothetical protein